MTVPASTVGDFTIGLERGGGGWRAPGASDGGVETSSRGLRRCCSGVVAPLLVRARTVGVPSLLLNIYLYSQRMGWEVGRKRSGNAALNDRNQGGKSLLDDDKSSKHLRD